MTQMCFELCLSERAGTLLGVSLKGAMEAADGKEQFW